MKILTHKFVENIPEVLEDDIIYVSISYETVVHKCCCGCGNEVVTPLSPAGWSLIFNGESISLKPSIGNWSFKCHSHYWIRNNKVHWSDNFSEDHIKEVQRQDLLDNKLHLDETVSSKNRCKHESWLNKIFQKIRF
jgi:hypothetical protein